MSNPYDTERQENSEQTVPIGPDVHRRIQIESEAVQAFVSAVQRLDAYCLGWDQTRTDMGRMGAEDLIADAQAALRVAWSLLKTPHSHPKCTGHEDIDVHTNILLTIRPLARIIERVHGPVMDLLHTDGTRPIDMSIAISQSERRIDDRALPENYIPILRERIPRMLELQHAMQRGNPVQVAHRLYEALRANCPVGHLRENVLARAVVFLQQDLASQLDTLARALADDAERPSQPAEERDQLRHILEAIDRVVTDERFVRLGFRHNTLGLQPLLQRYNAMMRPAMQRMGMTFVQDVLNACSDIKAAAPRAYMLNITKGRLQRLDDKELARCALHAMEKALRQKMTALLDYLEAYHLPPDANDMAMNAAGWMRELQKYGMNDEEWNERFPRIVGGTWVDIGFARIKEATRDDPRYKDMHALSVAVTVFKLQQYRHLYEHDILSMITWLERQPR